MFRRRRTFRHVFLALALLASAWTAGGCAAGGAYVYGDPAMYVGGPPMGYYGAPYAYYYDRPAYFVSGSWYYNSPSGWVVFQREPRALHDYRAYGYANPGNHVYRGPPPAYRAPAAPPRYGLGPAPHAPPPARMGVPHAYGPPARRR